ncbi:MAG: PQQ-binding-like beta-propeller repeat protein [Planctomycetota bacterium]
MVISIAAWCVALGSLVSGADDWNRFRGPDGRGVSDGTALPVDLSPERVAWKHSIPPGLSSPCLIGDRLFVTGHEGQRLSTSCLDRETGAVLWKRSVVAEALERHHEINSPASPTPCSDGERVVSYFGSFGLVAYDIEGDELWRRPLPMPKNGFGTAASPVLAGGRLVFVNGAPADPFVEAMDPATGESIWKVEQNVGWSTPAIWHRDGVDEVLVQGIWWLKAYDLRTGEERWAVPGLTDEPITTPVTGDELAFLTSYNMNDNPEVIGLPSFDEMLAQYDADGDERLNREEAERNESILSRFDADGEGDHPLRLFFRFLDRDKSGDIARDEWQKIFDWLGQYQHVNALLAVRPGKGDTGAEIAWQHGRGVPECPSALCYRGSVYLIKNGGILTCLAAANGEVRYRERLEAQGPYYASPVAGDGKIYLASARGEVTVLAAGETLDIVSTSDLGERLMATPALGRGEVFFRTEGHLIAFRVETER